MSVLTRSDSILERSLAQVRTALQKVAADPVARALAAETEAVPDPEGPLGRWLYTAWWCGVAEAPRPPGSVPPTAYAVLEAARRTSTTAEPGWLVLAATDVAVVAANVHTRERTTVRADSIVDSSRPGLPARPGDLVTLLSGASGLDATQSWWWATTSHEALPAAATDRWYVHVPDLDSALVVVPTVLALLRDVGIPASLKCPPIDALYGRRDAMVVYLPRDRAAEAETELVTRAADLVDLLGPEVPPLTRLLLPGVGAAQDPGGEVSYGQLRCAQLAAVAADTAPDCPTDRLVERLARLGVDLTRPEMLP
ncbi:MAG TPA: T3SS effector HopA1 family protein [Propionibacteriaceae bacterium]